jgi:hypothetical protein
MSFAQIELNWNCNSDDCEWCWPELASHLPDDTKLACHCGWLHRDNQHNPDWIEWLGEKPGPDDTDHQDCSSVGGPKAQDCDCGWCVSSRTALIAHGWGKTWR